MNTKHLANRFDTDGDFQPMYFDEEKPDYVLEALAGVAGLVGLVCFVILVFAL